MVSHAGNWRKYLTDEEIRYYQVNRKLDNDPRVTKVGKFLRRASLDELPQLINVFKRNMSIVGPRPPLLNEVAQYTSEQMHRLDVKPGLTCYWQCGGRSDLSFKQWVELDLKYIRERSLWTDFKIIVKMVPVVLTGGHIERWIQ